MGDLGSRPSTLLHSHLQLTYTLMQRSEPTRATCARTFLSWSERGPRILFVVTTSFEERGMPLGVKYSSQTLFTYRGVGSAAPVEQ